MDFEWKVVFVFLSRSAKNYQMLLKQAVIYHALRDRAILIKKLVNVIVLGGILVPIVATETVPVEIVDRVK